MVWAKLDDAILDNPKIANAGVLGFALHVAAITWCCRNLTDGFIPRSKARMLLDFSGVGAEIRHASRAVPAVKDQFIDAFDEVGAPDADEVAEQLMGVGLWRRDEDRDGYWLHDFLEYNPARQHVMAERAAKAAAGKLGAERRWGTKPKSVPPPKMAKPVAPPMAPPMAPGVADGWQSDAPVPVPVPDPIKKTTQGAVEASTGVRPVLMAIELIGEAGDLTPELRVMVAQVCEPAGVTLDADHEWLTFVAHCGREARNVTPAGWKYWLCNAAKFAKRDRVREAARGSPGRNLVQSADNRAWKLPGGEF